MLSPSQVPVPPSKYQRSLIKSGQPSIITIIGQVSNTASATGSTSKKTSIQSTSASSTTASSSSISTTSSTSSTISSTASSIAAGSATNPQTATPKSSSNHSVAIGVGVGLSVGIIVLGLIAGFYFHGQRQGRKSGDYLNAPIAMGSGKESIGPVPYYAPVAQVPPSELPHNRGDISPGELPHSPGVQRSELPDHQTWATLQNPYSGPQIH